jgi:hypothetical protein
MSRRDSIGQKSRGSSAANAWICEEDPRFEHAILSRTWSTSSTITGFPQSFVVSLKDVNIQLKQYANALGPKNVIHQFHDGVRIEDPVTVHLLAPEFP